MSYEKARNRKIFHFYNAGKDAFNQIDAGYFTYKKENILNFIKENVDVYISVIVT